MKTNTLWTKKLLSLVVVMTMAAMVLVPYGVMATGSSTITSDLDGADVIVGEAVEFTVLTIPNDDAGVMVMGRFEIEAEDADISKLEYYETTSGMEGWYEFPNKTFGEFGPAGTGFPMMEATSTFRITFATPGEYEATVSAVKVEDGTVLCSETIAVNVLDWADYTKLDAAIALGGKYEENAYTPESYKTLADAIAAATSVEEDLTEKEQASIDALEQDVYDAIDALVKVTTVNFYAVAVADEPSENYAMANKIVLVFGESIEEGADVASKLSIADVIESAQWINDTVYEVELKKGHGLSNDTVVEFVSDYSIKTVRGEALTDAEAVVAGNLEEAEEYVTATAMTATIVKNSARPGVSKDDKIVLVFNAPVYGERDTIDVNSMTAAVVDDSYTVYEIVLEGTEEINDDTLLGFENIVDVELNGTFNTSKAPVIVAALAVENSGNALCEGDEIVVYFDRPTNGAEVDANAVFGDATAEWNDANTILTFVLGADAVVENGMSINLGNMGIMDAYETVDYVGADFTFEGAFIIGEAPVVERVLIVDNNGTARTEGDQIIVSFNIPTNGPDLTADIVVKEGQGLGDDFTVEWNDENTEVVITVGKTATLDDDVLFDFGAWGITDRDGLCAYVGEIIEPEGSFGTSVAPKITRAIAFTQGTRHIIRVFFNTEVEVKGSMDVTVDNGFNLGTDFSEKWTNNGITYFDLVLGEDHSEFVTGVNTITFDGVLADKESGKTAESVSAIINGGFERDIEPEILSLTAYSNDGSGVAKAGDKIVLVLNSSVTSLKSEYDFVTEDKVTWIYTLSEDGEIEIGEEITFEIESLGKKYDLDANVGGNYGYNAEVKLLSVTAYSNDGSGVAKKGDTIAVVFNAPVTGLTSELGSVSTTDNMTWIITLSEDGAVEIGSGITFNVKSVATGEELAFEGTIAGSFGNETEIKLLSATVYSTTGNGVANVGDKVVLVFNAPVTGVESELGSVKTENSIVWTITLENTDVAIGDTLIFNVCSAATGKAYDTETTLKGNFGYRAEAELLSLTAYSQDGSGVAKKGDKIVAVFNMPVTGVKSTLGTVITENNVVWTITLASDDSVKIGDELTFKVKDAVTYQENTFEMAIEGNFGYFVEPEIISITAYSNDGSGVAKEGDEIVVIFNTAVEGVKSVLGDATTADGIVWTITIKNNNGVAVGDLLQFVVKSVASGEEKHLSEKLGGSFGLNIEPKALSVTAISKTGSGVAKVGDEIVVVFNTSVRVKKVNDTTVSNSEGYTFTYTIKQDGEFEVGSEFSLTVVSVATGEEYVLEESVGGSFGYSEMPEVKSATLSENNGEETILVVFDRATEMNNINANAFHGNNKHLGNATAAWVSDCVLKVTLGTDATTTNANVLNLSGLGIKSAATAADITGLENIAISGSLIPVVKSVDAADGVITVTFSARTNGKADISKLTTLLGAGAKTAWEDNNKTLKITLGENYTLTNNGYIVLNDMGIYDAFSSEYHVIGQYKVEGSVEEGVLVVNKIVAQSADKSCTTAQKGDKLIVKFNGTTNLNGSELNKTLKSEELDEIITVEGGNAEKLGVGYSGEWTAYDTLEITLGGTDEVEEATTDVEGETEQTSGAPTIAVGDMITVKSVAFANGEGKMEEMTVELTGSFNGREFVVTDGKIERTAEKNGDYRISMKVENTLLDTETVPTIVCVAYSGSNPVSVMRICVDVESSVQPVFEFAAGYKITSAKIYVFDEVFADMAGAPEVLAETCVIEVSK